MVTKLDWHSFAAKLLLLLLFCTIVQLWEIRDVYYESVYNTINQVRIVMMGQKWQTPQSFRIPRTASLICQFATGHLIGWGNIRPRVWLRSIQRSNRITICDTARSGIWLAENMGLRNLTGIIFSYVRARPSPAVLMQMTHQRKMLALLLATRPGPREDATGLTRARSIWLASQLLIIRLYEFNPNYNLHTTLQTTLN